MNLTRRCCKLGAAVASRTTALTLSTERRGLPQFDAVLPIDKCADNERLSRSAKATGLFLLGILTRAARLSAHRKQFMLQAPRGYKARVYTVHSSANAQPSVLPESNGDSLAREAAAGEQMKRGYAQVGWAF